jgi:hypothetical protein
MPTGGWGPPGNSSTILGHPEGQCHHQHNTMIVHRTQRPLLHMAAAVKPWGDPEDQCDYQHLVSAGDGDVSFFTQVPLNVMPRHIDPSLASGSL